MTTNGNSTTWDCNDVGLATFLETFLEEAAQVIPPDTPSGYCTFRFPYSQEVQRLIGDWGREGVVPAYPILSGIVIAQTAGR